MLNNSARILQLLDINSPFKLILNSIIQKFEKENKVYTTFVCLLACKIYRNLKSFCNSYFTNNLGYKKLFIEAIVKVER